MTGSLAIGTIIELQPGIFLPGVYIVLLVKGEAEEDF
jgi:hypothetical protein